MSVLIGLGVIPLSLLTRFISRAVFACNVPSADDDHVDMDLGYGAVFDAPVETRYSDGDDPLKGDQSGKASAGKASA